MSTLSTAQAAHPVDYLSGENKASGFLYDESRSSGYHAAGQLHRAQSTTLLFQILTEPPYRHGLHQ